MPDRFDEFWAAYPHKVGKIKARDAYAKAMKQRYSHDDIMAGLERYKTTKEDWRAWKHPAPWLNAGMWMDEPATKAAKSAVTSDHVLLRYIAETVRDRQYQKGRYPPHVIQQCVDADLLTKDEMKAAL